MREWIGSSMSRTRLLHLGNNSDMPQQSRPTNHRKLYMRPASLAVAHTVRSSRYIVRSAHIQAYNRMQDVVSNYTRGLYHSVEHILRSVPQTDETTTGNEEDVTAPIHYRDDSHESL